MSRDFKQFYTLGKKIVGAGVNYRSLVAERSGSVPKKPILFLKPTTTYISEGQVIEIPDGYEVNHEVELGVIIGKECKNVSVDEADKYIAGFCLALDLTAANIIGEARASGLPWFTGKGFDTATPVSSGIDKSQLPGHDAVRLWCSVNDQVRQDCTTADMVFPVKELVSYASRNMTLEPYDLILTGSPAGVGPIQSGDVIKAGLGDLITMCFKVK
uniref:oxaloacetate tautomerase n=1 Tax=Lygus hesperus TaxID=30085 RepID=A0A0A9VUS6_LYGHE